MRHPSPAACFPPFPARQVIAKCETRQSLFNFRALVDASDAIIISRGNLGLDVVRGRESWVLTLVGRATKGAYVGWPVTMGAGVGWKATMVLTLVCWGSWVHGANLCLGAARPGLAAQRWLCRAPRSRCHLSEPMAMWCPPAPSPAALSTSQPPTPLLSHPLILVFIGFDF